jgi:hypothetical protein
MWIPSRNSSNNSTKAKRNSCIFSLFDRCILQTDSSSRPNIKYTVQIQTNDMSTEKKGFTRPQEDHHNLALFSTWNAWSLRRKRSKQNLLDDLIGIDSIVQRHMTISATASAALETKKEILLLQHQHQQYMLNKTKQCIAKKQIEAEVNWATKQRHDYWQDEISRVPKMRRLNFHPSKKLPIDCDNQDSENQFTFWRNLNTLTGSIHGKTFDLKH